MLTFCGKRRQEAVLPGSKRRLHIWRSTLSPVIIVIISKAEASGKQDFVNWQTAFRPPIACQSRDLTRCYSLYNILEGFDVGILKLRKIILNVIVEIDLMNKITWTV